MMFEKVSEIISVLEKINSSVGATLLSEKEIVESKEHSIRFKKAIIDFVNEMHVLEQTAFDNPLSIIKALVHLNRHLVDMISDIEDVHDILKLVMDRYEPYYDAFLAKQKQDE